MKRYEYVNLHIGRLIGSTSEKHREIIDEYAQRGYRYVGYIPVKIADNGKVKEIDLIFETDC